MTHGTVVASVPPWSCRHVWLWRQSGRMTVWSGVWQLARRQTSQTNLGESTQDRWLYRIDPKSAQTCNIQAIYCVVDSGLTRVDDVPFQPCDTSGQCRVYRSSRYELAHHFDSQHAFIVKNLWKGSYRLPLSRPHQHRPYMIHPQTSSTDAVSPMAMYRQAPMHHHLDERSCLLIYTNFCPPK
jgi:hypothetical protein